jgi:hypothetical protein
VQLWKTSVDLGIYYILEKKSSTGSLGDYELREQKPWFNEEWLELLDQRKQAELQWLQNPSQTMEVM